MGFCSFTSNAGNKYRKLISYFIPLLTKMRQKLKYLPFILALFLGFSISLSHEAIAQEERKVVQFTGIIVDQDGVTEIPGVHVYERKTGRGTTTNVYGYFSMPAIVGEEITVSAIGYIQQQFIVPEGKNDRVNVLFRLEEDTVYLQNVDISLYVSEREFKQAILALNLPDQSEMIQGRLDGAAMQSMLQNMPYDASLNARYYFDQQFYYQQDNYGPRSNPFLNPFNWGRFIKSLKKK
jgi:hypothetical protein